MSALILPGRPGWFGMVSPREEEMPDFLKVIAQGFRTPKRKWENLWRLRRGELNHVLGMRQSPKLRKYQTGVIGHVAAAAAQQGVATGSAPNLQDVVDNYDAIAPAITRVSLYYDSDGAIMVDLAAQGAATIVYTKLTTDSDDANDHTNDWWPDQPDVNEGLNWDIRYTNNTSGGTVTARHFFQTVVPADRIEDTWYLLDTVSNDAGDAIDEGALGVNRTNGTAKSPTTGVGDLTTDVEIRATGSGSAVASHNVSLEVEGT